MEYLTREELLKAKDSNGENSEFTDEEIYDLLREISEIDEDIEEEEESSEELNTKYGFDRDGNIQDKNEDLESDSANDAFEAEEAEEPEKTEEAKETIKESPNMHLYLVRRQLHTSLQRAAFDQSEISLDMPMNIQKARYLVSILTEGDRLMVNKYEELINKRIAFLLKLFIPKRLRTAYKYFPNSVKTCPGFIYTTSTLNDDKIAFYAKPICPYFLEQGSELAFIMSNSNETLIKRLDNFIYKYNKSIDRLAKKEIAIARSLKTGKVYTYFDLLKHNVIWFSALYKGLTGKTLNLDKPNK